MTNHTAEWVNLNDARLWLEVAGAGEVVVFVHGFSLDARMWDAQFEVFAQHFRVVRYDARGFGRSSLPNEPYRHVDDLCAMLDHLGLARASIVGLSMGGGIALDFALEYPQRVQALVVVDGAVAGHTWSSTWEDTIKPVWDHARAGDVNGARAAWLAHPLFAPVLESEAAANFQQIVMDYSGWHWVNKNPITPVKPPALERLEAITAPTLVVLGERDLLDFHAIADRIVQHVPDAKQHVMAGAGHIPNMEAPEAFNALVLGFLHDRVSNQAT